MNKGAKIGIGVVSAAMLAVAGFGVYTIADSLTGGSDAKPKGPRTVVNEAPTAQQAAEAAKTFLDAWAKGDLEAAGAATDKPETAIATLTAFRTKVHPSALTLTPGGPAGAAPSPAATATDGTDGSAAPATSVYEVPLTFSAKVEFEGTADPWAYQGSLGMVKMSDGKAAVRWTSGVIHPKLTAGHSITVKPIVAPPSQLGDRNGKPLTGFPSLAPLLSQIKNTGPTDPGDAGTGVVITNDSGQGTPEKLFTITEPKPAKPLRLTIDARLQQAAEDAMREQSKGGTLSGSVVAIEPSTGNILAFANAPAAGQNRAFGGITAPGSTMKVITAAALLEAGVTPGSTMACPAETTAGGQKVQNDFKGEFPNYTLAQDFAHSCNTAFINAGSEHLKPATLPKLAKDAFGLGLVWHTGLPAFDTDIPVPNSMAAALPEFIGQGAIRTNSLAMASVSATVQNGTFRQPVLVPGMTEGVAHAPRTLSSSVLTDLRKLMRGVVTDGTATDAMAGIPNVSAKTGTAEIDGKDTNAWFTAFRGNLAVAAEIEGGGHGAVAAAPAAGKLLRIGNN
ncbi:penicillin-binding transpeptidase domain-containing protein [Kitasatospora sp. NBC_01539]|uniref:penicillin-binding transpeptidase domain-containing protein n=1 Tax=Kitasatospora sp. NBC_01539 TaxID=2903577 RepID=UPI0038600A17